MADLIANGRSVTVRRSPPVARLLLHCDPDDAPSIAAQAGIDLPGTMLRSSTTTGWSALHLAPDEWLLVGEPCGTADMAARFAAIAEPHSLVDIADRNLGLIVEGSRATALLAAVCPLDIDGMSVGSCTRTIFGKVMIVLWRTGSETYGVEYTRSFDDYVVGMATLIAGDVG